MSSREIAERILMAGIKGVLPGKIIGDLISIRGSFLSVGYLGFNLEQVRNIYVLGAGISSAAMGHYLENILKDRISGGYIVTKYGHYIRLKNIEVEEAASPLPDSNSFDAAAKLRQVAENAGENDLVICLWSGGGSSLMADYPVVSSPEDMIYLYELLEKNIPDIREADVITKHLSGISGGSLARHIWPAKSISILLSDLPGDPPDLLESGPTVPDDSTFDDTIRILEKYCLISEAPIRLVNYLFEGRQGLWPETPKTGDQVFGNTSLIIAGSNKKALQAARSEAERNGLTSFIITPELKDDVSDACSFIVDTINSYKSNNDIRKPVCLLFGGRTSIKVTGNGLGGRNQHLVLRAALSIKDIPGVTLLAADTDGNDGNTGMAGAVADSGTVNAADSAGVDPEWYLNGFDSFNFFRKTGGHISTGCTMTDVMDILIAIID